MVKNFELREERRSSGVVWTTGRRVAVVIVVARTNGGPRQWRGARGEGGACCKRRVPTI